VQDSSFLIVIVLGGIALAVLTYVFTVRARDARQREVATFAAQHGLRVEGDVNPFTDSALDRNETVRNVVRGPTPAGEIIIHDHAPALADGSQGRIASTVAAFRVANIPEFHLISKGWLDAGTSRVDFPAHPEFSRRFLLQTPDETAVRRLFSGAVLDAFLALPEKRKWDVTGGWGLLLVTFGKARGADFRELLEESTRLAKTLR
jgi:hypothetical protein